MEMVRYRLRVEGRVQGVGFRYFVKSAADSYNLVGCVRNEYDGSVSIQVQGEESMIDMFIKDVERGNGFSRIDRLFRSRISPNPGESGFKILR